MIKGLFFDFDHTLIFLADAHYIALNKAIEEIAGKQFTINDQEQASIYNGLSTKTKLNMLVKAKNLDASLIDIINNAKQNYTLEAINQTISENKILRQDLLKLKSQGYLIYCVSNAMKQTVIAGLTKLNILDVFDHVIGNDEVKRQKPAPDIYLQAFIHACVDPKEALIIEDSKHGRESAYRSGAHILTVDDPNSTTYDNITNAIKLSNEKDKSPWVASNLKVVLPMSGAGSRFSVMGFTLPKPLIDVNGKPMIQVVVENMNVEAEFIFIVQKAHYEQYNLGALLPLIAPGCKIVQTNGLTQGAACSVLLAKEHINNDDHLFIINSDQYLEWDSKHFFNTMLTSNVDAGVITFEKENDVKWSYVKVNDEGFITEVKEKQPISNKASVGGYYFNKGKDFVEAAEAMIEAKDMTRQEYYVAPIINYLKPGSKTIPYDIPTDAFWGIGTPEDLENFLKNHK